MNGRRDFHLFLLILFAWAAVVVLAFARHAHSSGYAPALRKGPEVYATDYGAKCDGSTDDTGPLQSALTAASAAHASLSIPAGTCILSNQLVVDGANGLAVRGQGRGTTTLRYADGLPGKGYILEFRASSFVVVEDLTLDGNRAAGTSAGAAGVGWFATHGAGPYMDLAVRRCTIQNMSWDGIIVTGSGSSPAWVEMRGLVVEDNVFSNNYNSYDTSNPRMDVTIITGHDIIVRGNLFEEGSSPPATATISSAVRAEPDPGATVDVSRVTIANNTVHGKPLVSVGGPSSLSYVTITGNVVDTSAAYPRLGAVVVGYGASNVTVSGNSIVQRALAQDHAVMTVARNARNVTITGNVMTAAPYSTSGSIYGVADDSSAGGTELLTITSNIIMAGIPSECTASGDPYYRCTGAGTGTLPGSGDGVHLAYRTGAVISANWVSNWGTSAIALIDSHNTIVADNHLVGITAGISVSGTMDGYSITGNVIDMPSNQLVDTATGNAHRRVGGNSAASAGTVLPNYNYNDSATFGSVQMRGTNSPATCSASLAGALYFDTSLNEACFCNGTSWCRASTPTYCGSSTSCGTTIVPSDHQPVIVVRDNGTASLAQYSAVQPSSGADDRVEQAAANSRSPVGCSIASAPATGDDIQVAVGGIASCLVKADGGAYPNVTRGDALSMSATAGKLRKATVLDAVFGYAQETTSADSSIRVLIQPAPPQQKVFVGNMATLDSATRYFPIHGVASNITAENPNRIPMAGAITATAMACQLVTAPGVGTSRTFTLRKVTADVADLTCTIADTAKTCTDTGSTAVSAGEDLDWKATYSGAPASTQGACYLTYYSTDGAM